MDSGDIITFTYNRRGVVDKFPSIIYLEEDKEKIYGFNLNYIPRANVDLAVKLVKKRLFADMDFSNNAKVEKALEELNYIDDRLLMKEMALANSGISKEALKRSMIKKNTRTILKILESTVRSYRRKFIERSKVISYREYLNGPS